MAEIINVEHWGSFCAWKPYPGQAEPDEWSDEDWAAVWLDRYDRDAVVRYLAKRYQGRASRLAGHHVPRTEVRGRIIQVVRYVLFDPQAKAEGWTVAEGLAALYEYGFREPFAGGAHVVPFPGPRKATERPVRHRRRPA